MKTKKTTKKVVAKKAAPKKVAVKKAAPKKAISKKKEDHQPTVANKHIITKVKGFEMVKRFKQSMKDLRKVKFELGKQFDKSLFELLLQLKGMQTVRIYNAIDDANKHTFVITALDKKSRELFFKIKSAAGKDDEVVDGVGDMGNQCTEPPKEDQPKDGPY
jgi:hypothetical protein